MLQTIKQIVLTAVVLVVVAGCGDSESQKDKETGLGPREIANKVIACYADMKTYSSDGDTVSDMDMSNFDMQGVLESMPEDVQNNMGDLEKAKLQMLKQMTLKHTLRITLARPEQFCIEWLQEISDSVKMAGATWTEKGKNYLFIADKKREINGTQMALGSATGVSGRAVNNIPFLFFGFSSNLLGVLQQLTLLPSETVEGDDCYVLSGTVNSGLPLTYLISRKDYLVRRIRQNIGGDSMAGNNENLTDASLKEGLEVIGEDASEESVSKMKMQMEAAAKAMKHMKVTMTETHRNIMINPDLAEGAFLPVQTAVTSD